MAAANRKSGYRFKSARAVLLAGCLMGLARAGDNPVPAETVLIAPAPDSFAQVVMGQRKGGTLSLSAAPERPGRHALRVRWNRERDSFLEWSWKPAPAAANGGHGVYRVELFLPEPKATGSVAFRLRDARGETFQWKVPVPADAEAGWLSLSLDPSVRPADDHWGGPEEGKNRLDWPLVFSGLAPHFRPNAGAGELYQGAIYFTPAAEAPPVLWQSASMGQHFQTPDRAFVLRFNAPREAAADAPPAEMRITDLAGRAVLCLSEDASAENTTGTTNTASAADERSFSVPGLPAGYYSARPAGAAKGFGLVVLPDFEGEVDPFFGVDAFLSWTPGGREAAPEILALLRRFGVGALRDRLLWDKLQAGPDDYTFDNQQYAALRRLYAETGTDLLDVHHSSPAWMHPDIPRFPEDLTAAHAFWTALAGAWRGRWPAVEGWNEPEGGFGGNLPADQAVPGIKAMRHALAAASPETLLGGLAFTSLSPASRYHRNCAENGLLDQLDFVSFHTYGEPGALAGLAREYRAWLAEHGRADLPLWLTEAGRAAWQGGGDAAENRRIGDDLARQAAEARALGLARFFVFAWYDLKEGGKRFGLLDENRAPRAQAAAWFQQVRQLSGKRFIGDLKGDLPAGLSVRVFDASPERPRPDELLVAVLQRDGASGGADSNAAMRWRPDFPFRRALGMDGRALPDDLSGADDGIVYLEVERAALAGRLDAAAVPAPAAPAIRRVPGPIALFPQPDFTALATIGPLEGYGVNPGAEVPIRLTVFNFSAEPRALEISVSGDASPSSTPKGATRSLVVPAKDKAVLSYAFSAPADAAAVAATAMATDENAPRVSFLAREAGSPPDAPALDRAALFFRVVGATAEARAYPATAEAPLAGPSTPFGGLEHWVTRIESQPWNSAEDLDAAFRFGHDAGHLYLEVDVTDDLHVQSGVETDLWQGDSVQLGIQTGKPRTLADRSRLSEFTFAWNEKSGPLVRRERAQGERPVGPVPAVKLSVRREGIDTRYRIAIPAEELDLPALRAGEVLRLTLLVNDNDGAGRKGYLIWGGGLGNHKNPEAFNRLILDDAPVPAVAAKIEGRR